MHDPTMRIAHFALPLILTLAALPLQADAYKCRLPDGGIEISTTPCKSNANTLAVRPTETVDEAAREQAERDLARMKDYVATQSAEIRTRQAEEEKKSQEAQGRKAQQAVTRSTSKEACLETLANYTVDSALTLELLAQCRSKPAQPKAPDNATMRPMQTPLPMYPDWTTQCIQQVLAQRLPPQIQQERLLACQGRATVNRPQRPETRPEPRPEKPQRPTAPPSGIAKPCPPNDRYCVR